MSYLIDATNEDLAATFSGTHASPLTIALYIKVSDHPTASSVVMQLGASNASVSDSVSIRTGATDNQWGGRYTDPGGTSDTALETEIMDGTWGGLVATFPDELSRSIYTNTYAQSDTAVVARTASGDVFKYLRIGESLAGAEDLGTAMAAKGAATARVAELAVWNAVLSQAQIEQYMAGAVATTIAAANLIGYWPLNVDAGTQTNLGVGTMTTDLTVSGATYDADHPTITGGATTYLKLLAEASAASAASIEGVVLNATRDTVIGEFTGQAFEASLEGGEAVLLIDVADITPNGSTLTTSDTPLVFAYNATGSTIGPGSATVVEL